MNLRHRLIAANASIVIIPVLATLVIGSVSLFIFSRFRNDGIGFDNAQNAAVIGYEIIAASGAIWSEKPENLAKIEFAQYLSARLADVRANVLILADGSPVYMLTDVSSTDIEKLLPMRSGTFSGNITISGVNHLVSVNRFVMEDGRDGRIVILTPVDDDSFAAGAFVLFIVLVFIASFLTTNIINSGKLSRSIAKPLEHLVEAVSEISSGNLDFSIVEEGDEEIREVLRALESLRLKLKDSVTEQIRSDDNRKMLISSISHDLKTPITSIKGYVEGILDGVPKTPGQKERYLRTILAKAVQVDNMIDDLVLYSRLDLNQIPFNFEPTDVVRYFNDRADENEPEMTAQNIALSFINTLPDSCCVMIDREKMRRAVQNILDNARKYSKGSDKKIDIILRQTRDNVIIEIADNGTGIPKDDLALIFERFYRTDKARNTAGGSGLGLAITREIVEAHDGQIWVTSQESEGTQFMISLSKSACTPESPLYAENKVPE